jgi:L-asparaginase II
MPDSFVRVTRSGLEESTHGVDVAVTDAGGNVVAFSADPGRVVFARSSMKPLQATASLSHAPFDFTDAEVAVMCASHNAEPVHVEAVRSLMARAGVQEAELQCPQVRPWDDETLAARPQRARINSDCSGKHAGMLAACHAEAWPTDGYREPGHPLQQEILALVLRVSAMDSVHVGVDGCGVAVHGLPLHGMARIFASLSAPDRWGPYERDASRAAAAMEAHPYLVAGRNRVDTAIMENVPRVLCKGGAEGLLCATLLDRGLGVAVKVRDGNHRAAGPALISVLRDLDVIDGAAEDRLSAFGRPAVLGGGRPVGELSAHVDLERS